MPPQPDPSIHPAYDTLRVGIALYDPRDGSICDVNGRAVSILGYERPRIRSLDVDRYTANTYDFSAPDFHERLRAAASGESQQFVWRVKRGDGTLVWVRVDLAKRTADEHDSGRPEADRDRPYVRAELRDVTDLYDATHREELFWRILRHNIRNKSAIIAGYAEEIVDGEDPAQVREMATTINETAMALGNTATSVKQIQGAISRRSGERRVRDAGRAVRETVVDCREAFPAARIEVVERETLGIAVDSAFKHALRHAVENAIVHSEAREPTVEVRIDRSPNTGRAEISIVDSNPPIGDDELDALFRPKTRTNTLHGSGVGLFVMRWCVESLGGEIGFERRHPRGNTVRLYLPPKTSPENADGSSTDRSDRNSTAEQGSVRVNQQSPPMSDSERPEPSTD